MDREESSTAEERWMQKGNGIFSPEALAKMRSPEKLDTTMSITTPIGWMGLISVAVMLLAVVIWSIFGSFTVKADGMGLILDPAGVTKVSTLSAGTVDDIFVHTGQSVKKGDLIAHVSIVQAAAATRMAQYGPELATSSREAATRVHEFDSRLYEKEATEYVYSPVDGTVDEIMVDEGNTVGSGSPIANVRVDGGREYLKGVLYIPVAKGKRVERGQTIQLAPNGVDISQTGSLLGTVRSVSQYPVSPQTMHKTLGNEQLAQWIISSQQSAVMEVAFDLVRNPDSESGYLWTSRVGEHKPITAGSFVTGSIIIERTPPIEKVFRKLSQWLRGR